MNFIGKLIDSIKYEMEVPMPYGLFHLVTLLCIVICIVLICISNKKHSEFKLRFALGMFGYSSLILEIIKQLIWSTSYNPSTGITTWNYQWYGFPFQFCSTPMYAACIATFLKEGKLRRALTSYIGYFTILGSLMVMLVPTDIYQVHTLINIHTTVLHAGGLVLSLFLLIHRYVKPKWSYFFSGFIVYCICVLVAETLNVCVYKSGVLNGETFDMFFISPFFKTGMPVFTIVEQYVNDVVYVIIYVFAFMLGSSIVFFISRGKVKKEYSLKELHKLQIEYIERFNLPFKFNNRDKKDALRLLRKSLEENTPYI